MYAAAPAFKALGTVIVNEDRPIVCQFESIAHAQIDRISNSPL